MILIIFLLFFITVYIQLGAFEVFQIIIWLIVFITSSVLSGINPSNIQFNITKIISICVIIYILWSNSSESVIHSAILWPLSIYKISFPKDIKEPFIVVQESEKEENFHVWDNEEIKNFLKSLSNNDNYAVWMEFQPSDLEMDVPYLLLSKPFLINKYSSTTTIEKFINEKLENMVDLFYLDNKVIQPSNHMPGPVVKFTYYKIHTL
jgi:hypothetical protein